MRHGTSAWCRGKATPSPRSWQRLASSRNAPPWRRTNRPCQCTLPPVCRILRKFATRASVGAVRVGKRSLRLSPSRRPKVPAVVRRLHMSAPRVAPLPSTRKYRILAQDPSVRDATGAIITTLVEIPYEQVDPGPKGARVHVVDFDAALGIFYPPTEIGAATEERWLKSGSKQEVEKLIASRDFRAYNAYAIVMRTLARF